MNTKNIRIKAMLTQLEFANIIGVSTTTIVKWESGKCKPSFKQQRKLLDFCKNNGIEICK